jgi:hypothetical protein
MDTNSMRPQRAARLPNLSLNLIAVTDEESRTTTRRWAALLSPNAVVKYDQDRLRDSKCILLEHGDGQS